MKSITVFVISFILENVVIANPSEPPPPGNYIANYKTD